MSGTHILVDDDDDPCIQRLLHTNLKARGYDVAVTETGEYVLHLVSVQRPDLVILDLLLPGISGIELCRLLRANSMLPILVLSVQSEERIKVRAFDDRADTFLVKPSGTAEVLVRVRALLRRPVPGPADATTLRMGDFVVARDRSSPCLARRCAARSHRQGAGRAPLPVAAVGSRGIPSRLVGRRLGSRIWRRDAAPPRVHQSVTTQDRARSGSSAHNRHRTWRGLPAHCG